MVHLKARVGDLVSDLTICKFVQIYTHVITMTKIVQFFLRWIFKNIDLPTDPLFFGGCYCKQKYF